MLTKTFDYYAIRTTVSEYASCDRALFDTLEETFNARMEYANWWEQNGNVYIRHYRLHSNENEVIEEFRFTGDTYYLDIRNGKYLGYTEDRPVEEFLKREA